MSLLEGSVFLLCALVVLESMVLRSLFKETAETMRGRRRPEPASFHDVVIGSPLPPFQVRRLDGKGVLTTRDLTDRAGVLFFMDPASSGMTVVQLRSVINAFWEKSDGTVHLVCGGSEESCRALSDEIHEWGWEHAVTLLVDTERALARLLRIYSFPAAVLFAEDGTIRKVGRPATPETMHEIASHAAQ